MAITVSRTKSARTAYEQDAAVTYTRVKFSTPQIDVAAKVFVGVLPQDCLPLDVVVRINSTWNKDLIIGTSGSASGAASSLDIQAGTTGVYVTDRLALNFASGTTAGDVPLYVQTATTGPTVGEADIWIRYIPAS